MNKYLVGISDLEFREANVVVIDAEDKQEAIDKYIANVEIKDSFFLEDVYSTACNMSYAEQFYIDNNGEYVFDDFGNPRYTYEEIEEFFDRNIRKLFKDNEDWYNLYMSMRNQADDEKRIVFPDEMLIHMYKQGRNIEEILCLHIGTEIKELV